MLKTKIMAVAHKLQYVSSLHRQVQRQGRYPAGHYYSPIPSQDDVRINEVNRTGVDLPDVDLDREGQRHNLEDLSRFYAEQPFTEKQSADLRYYFDQSWFCYSDAIFLYSFLRRHNPRRIIEVGSGFSSAVILDTVGFNTAKSSLASVPRLLTPTALDTAGATRSARVLLLDLVEL